MSHDDLIRTLRLMKNRKNILDLNEEVSYIELKNTTKKFGVEAHYILKHNNNPFGIC